MIRMFVRIMLLALLFPFHAAFAQWTADSSANTPVCQITGDQMYPQIVSDGQGGAIIVWQDGRGSAPNIYAQRLDAGGNPQWGTNGVIVCSEDNALQPQLVSDGAGGAIITWFDRRFVWPNTDVFVQRLNADGDTLWKANGVRLSRAANTWSYPTIARDGNGGAIVTWIGDTDSLFVQRVNAAGDIQWTEGGVNLGPGGNEPKIVSDGAGGAIVAFYRYQPDYMGTDVFAHKITAGGVAIGPPTGDTMCVATDYQSHPSIAPDGSGGAIVSWLDARNGDASHVYAQHIGAGGGYLWAKDGVEVSTKDAAVRTMIVSDDAGGAIITWVDYLTSRVYAQRINGSGQNLWPDDVRVEPAFEGGYPTIVSDGAGGAVFAIEPDGGNALRAQHLLSDGNVAYPAGRTIAWGAYMKTRPVFTYDDQGGAIVAWEDSRHYNSDIYAQRIGLGLSTSAVGPGSSDHALPEKFSLGQNYPNPFNPTTTIEYAVAGARGQGSGVRNVQLIVYDVLGREVAVLVNGVKPAGTYTVRFDASGLASGVYLYRLNAGGYTETKRMVVVK